jgi:Zn-dependent alcohol dehydrogenase
LIGLGAVDLGAIAEARRAERQLPAIDSRGLHLDWEEYVGVTQAVVVEKVGGASQKVVGIQDPSFDGNGDAELVLFIALAR